MPEFGPLVSTHWLEAHIDDPDLKIVDGSWRMPGGPPARMDYEERHIEGAVFFDIDKIADQRSTLPHMLPSPAQFETAIGAMGLSDKDRLVVYDDQGIFSSARVWWTFRAMGHRAVAVLDGGLPKWLDEGGPVTDEKPPSEQAAYKAQQQPHMVCAAGGIREALTDRKPVIVDARPAARFFGEVPEPRKGLRSGHMPGACNIPVCDLLNNDGTMRPPEEIAALFSAAGADLDMPIITTCGSGVTAAVLCLALETISHDRHSLYDGSWTEWGDERNAERDFPVSSGKEQR